MNAEKQGVYRQAHTERDVVGLQLLGLGGLAVGEDCEREAKQLASARKLLEFKQVLQEL